MRIMGRYRGKGVAVVLIPAVLLCAGVLSGPRVAGAAEDGKTLFNQKCGACHSTRVATSRKETKETWAAVVKAMQAKKDNWISDAQARMIVEYLSTEYGKK
jgi:mono/diheme cytochrome c family protein